MVLRNNFCKAAALITKGRGDITQYSEVFGRYSQPLESGALTWLAESAVTSHPLPCDPNSGIFTFLYTSKQNNFCKHESLLQFQLKNLFITDTSNRPGTSYPF